MHISELTVAHQESEIHSKEDIRFGKSLQELKDLRSQLHYAADYCEATFLNAKQKQIAVESTKEYICMAVVTLVDHLGNVSANLNQCISETNEFSEAELRINCFKQRLLSCEQYVHSLALTKLRLKGILPRHHLRYLSPQIASDVERSNEGSRDPDSSSSTKILDKLEPDAEDAPLFLSTCTDKTFPAKNPSLRKAAVDKVRAVHDGLSTLSNGLNPIFYFQGGTPKLGRGSLSRRKSLSVQGSDILSLIRRAKRNTMKN